MGEHGVFTAGVGRMSLNKTTGVDVDEHLLNKPSFSIKHCKI